MPVKLNAIVEYCDARTRRAAYKDAPGAFNGLQVANLGTVTRLGAAVDAGVATFNQALQAKVDFLLVHHGLFWEPPRPIVGPTYERLALLLCGNCALYSSHLPLDGHPEIGNNALLAKELHLTTRRGFLQREGEAIGCIAENLGTRFELRTRLEKLFPRTLALEFGSETPREIAFCSGSGNSAVPELRPSGLDTLVTGELREEWYTYAQEHRLNLYLCGHYATETYGVRALAAELATHFALPWTFLPSSNPL